MAQIITLEMQAAMFANTAHGKSRQVRKYTGLPYIVHPAAVVEIVASVHHTPEMIAAAWLHDTLEDTDTTLQVLTDEFGLIVSTLVLELTDQTNLGDGNRAIRKEMERSRLAKVRAATQTIKLADIIHNTREIFQCDPSFAKVYVREAMALVEVLTKGDPILRIRAAGQCSEFLRNNPQEKT